MAFKKREKENSHLLQRDGVDAFEIGYFPGNQSTHERSGRDALDKNFSIIFLVESDLDIRHQMYENDEITEKGDGESDDPNDELWLLPDFHVHDRIEFRLESVAVPFLRNLSFF